jgi:hypothetical protein
MKSTRKHDLQTNVLADFLGRAFQDAKPHANAIGYAALGLAIVVLAVILIVVPLWSGSDKDTGSSGALAKAMAAGTSDAMRAFLTSNSGSPQASAARLALGDRLLAEAVRTSSAETAKTNLDDARKEFEAVVNSSPVLAPMAKVGLALVTVQEGDLTAGVASLEEIVKQHPTSLAAIKAQETIERLKGYKQVAFSNEAPDALPPVPGAPQPRLVPRIPGASMTFSATPTAETPIPSGAWPSGAVPKSSGTTGLPSSLVPGRP